MLDQTVQRAAEGHIHHHTHISTENLHVFGSSCGSEEISFFHIPYYKSGSLWSRHDRSAERLCGITFTWNPYSPNLMNTWLVNPQLNLVNVTNGTTRALILLETCLEWGAYTLLRNSSYIYITTLHFLFLLAVKNSHEKILGTLAKPTGGTLINQGFASGLGINGV